MKNKVSAVIAVGLRRRLLGLGLSSISLATCGLTAKAQNRSSESSRGARSAGGIRTSSRARYRLAGVFEAAVDTLSIVPFSAIDFQSGGDFTLQPDGKVLINTAGLYEIVFSTDWQALAKPRTDIDLHEIGIKRQEAGQADTPISLHARIGYINTPGSDAPKTARYQGRWNPPPLALGATASVDIKVSPPDSVNVGDVAMASHTQLSDEAIGAAAVNALVVQAKVVGPDTVRVSIFNPSIVEGVDVPLGDLKVMAMNTTKTRGSTGDGWQVLHTASTLLAPGDKVYAIVLHKVPGTLLQGSKSTYLQVDRLE
jgi:hypothetical protein